MRVFSKLKFFIVSLALVLLFGNIGLGAYIVGSKNASIEGNVSINSVGDAVCEIGNTKYTSIEKALEMAQSSSGAQTIRVLPGVNGYTITRPCTLGSGDSLLIPYDDTCSLKNPTADVEISGFADNNPDTYRKTLVVLSSTLTIEEGASLVICGKVGGANPQGGTTGDYAELQFTSFGYIDCSGDITCYGYIHDQAEKQRAVDDVCIYMHKGTFKEPLAMYDWGSATNAQGKMGNGAFPINHFDFPNVRPPMYFEYGSKLVAMGNVYAASMHIKADGTIVATDSDEAFLQLKVGSGVLINVNNVDDLKTSNSVSRHSVSVRANGDLNISAVVVELKVGIINYTLDSKKYYLPISGIYDVTMVSGTCNVNYNTKFLPGSSLIINQGASVEFVKNAVFYNSTMSDNGSKMPDSSTFTKPAKLINNGTLTIDNGFDGDIQTTKSDSKLIVKSAYTIVSDCYEATKDAKVGPFSFGGARGLIAVSKTSNDPIDMGFAKNCTYFGNVSYWYYDSISIDSCFTINEDPKVSINEDSRTFSVGLKLIISSFDTRIINTDSAECIWTSPSSQGSLKNITITPKPDDKCICSITGNVTAKEKTIIPVSVKVTLKNGLSSTLTYNITVDASSSCLLPDTMVAMADGSYKRAGDIKAGDMVLSFNHETGKVEASKIILNPETEIPASLYDVVTLKFSDNSEVGVIGDHGFFDMTLNKYVYINKDNYKQYIGHQFYGFKHGTTIPEITTLVAGSVKETFTTICSPVSANNLNIITEDKLGISGEIEGLFNFFDYDPVTLKYDEAKKQADIEKYGLLTYEDYKDLLPYEVYEVLPCQYMSVSIGKGLITWDKIKEYINHWSDQLLQ